jgi:hypothetical protein
MPREQSHGWAARLRLLSRNPREIAGIVDRTSVLSDPLAGRERDVSKSSSHCSRWRPWRKETLQSSCVYQRWMIRVRELSRTEHGTELATKSKKLPFNQPPVR